MSPLIAKFIKNNFENIEVRASVNMKIGSVEGMDYISEYFDSYYMQRELNRDIKKLNSLKIGVMITAKSFICLPTAVV